MPEIYQPLSFHTAGAVCPEQLAAGQDRPLKINMIRIDFTLAIAAYLIIAMGAVFFLWLAGSRQKEKELFLDQRFIWFCSVCTYTYINTKDDVISNCPRCGGYNKKA